MTIEDAWKTIEFNKEFNIEYWPSNLRPEEAAILLARKEALALAWKTVAGLVPPAPREGGV